ncbi:MAG: tetratricopeptide repeat protein [Candidatus Kapaibacteriales bacterium]
MAVKEKVEKNKASIKETEPNKVQQFFDTYRIQINIGATALIVLLALIFVIRYFASKSEEERERKASVAISRVMEYLDKADYQRALYGDNTRQVRGEKVIGLIDIVKEYKSTPQGKVAALYAGNCFLYIEKYKEAIEYFSMALNSKAKTILEGANAGLAVAYEKVNNYDQAAKFWGNASNFADAIPIKDRYAYFQALCYEKLGQNVKAVELYRTIIGHNQSEFVGLAKGGLVRFGIIIE